MISTPGEDGSVTVACDVEGCGKTETLPDLSWTLVLTKPSGKKHRTNVRSAIGINMLKAVGWQLDVEPHSCPTCSRLMKAAREAAAGTVS